MRNLRALLVFASAALVLGPPRPALAAAPASLTRAPAANPAAGEKALPDVAEQSVPSVVNISASRIVQGRSDLPFFNDPFFRFGPEPRPQKEKSLGSGVIVTADGVLLTNNHVVEGAQGIEVTLNDRRSFKASIVGTDPKSDLAVLKLEGQVKDLKPMAFGDSSKLRLGETVVAIGDPFGVGETVTAGIVSAKGRANVGIVDYEDFIQTDAAINPGNSGGALVNMRAELVGINTAILSRSGGYQGVGLAIPSNMAKPIMETLMHHGKVVRGWLGVAIQDITPELAQAMKLEAPNGVLISDVVPSGPADEAGLKSGDVVLNVNGQPVESSGALRNLIAQTAPKTEVSFDLLRNGKPMTIKARLREQPESGTAGGGGIEEGQGLLGGVSFLPLDKESRAKYHLPERVVNGVVIDNISPRSPAAAAGLRPGDVIMEIDKKRIERPKDLEEAYQPAADRVLLRVFHQGTTVYLLLQR
jgi:serine protease Do